MVNPLNSQQFYQSKEWKSLRLYKLCQTPYCERCLRDKNKYITATDVHHIKEVKPYPLLALEYSNLESLCKSCHSKHTRSEHNPNPVEGNILNKAWDLNKGFESILILALFGNIAGFVIRFTFSKYL